MKKTKLKHKILLIFFSILFSFFLLEIGLRVGGFIFLSIQEHFNQTSLQEGSEYRILCIGESTTALGGKDAYPRQLEKILNIRQNKIKFSVINKGIPAITTNQIASSLNQHLDSYDPHMVIAMIGINDKNGDLDKPSRLTLFLENFRVYKLKNLINSHLSKKTAELKDRKLRETLENRKKQIEKDPNSVDYTKLAAIYLASNKNNEATELLQRALALNPRNYAALTYLGLLQKRLGEYQKAANTFEKVLNLDISGDTFLAWNYAELAECYKLLEDYPKAERIYRKAMKKFPTKTGAFGCLAEAYIDQDRYKEARQLLETQLKINPKATLFYGKLAHCYRKENQDTLAESLLRKALKINPDSIELYFELGAFLLENKRYAEAEEVFLEAFELKDNLSQALITLHHQLIKTYQNLGKLSKAKGIKRNLELIQVGFKKKTSLNYKKIKEILESKEIDLVASQYPLRDVASLKKLLGNSGNVIFVDNQKNFQEAVEKDGYDAYFTDRFAGNFGHCTTKGNYILANNVADMILSRISPTTP